ncbi:hypothetical protein B0A48_18591 [Cryoendolithus antarcticus]|uniref:Uncharacterized protein n=1 Tax=Cryoendolithus antarcticus TaxID=1507870 RepID=A0A1V8S8A4_9PEZI|nr:hypothetical protein B0A48_18591 [Cryoendolithus antarcticus]
MARLFFAVASPEACSQFEAACKFVREQEIVPLPLDISSVSGSVQALRTLDQTDHVGSILCRYHLLTLVAYRNEREPYHQDRRPNLRDRVFKYGYVKQGARKQNEGVKTVSSLALDDLMLEACADLKGIASQRLRREPELKRQRDRLYNRLSDGRNWSLMADRFSRGILALVPTGGSFGLHNHEVQDLPKEAFEAFLVLLEEHRGPFLYDICERVTRGIHKVLLRDSTQLTDDTRQNEAGRLDREPFDSPALLKVCNLDMT